MDLAYFSIEFIVQVISDYENHTTEVSFDSHSLRCYRVPVLGNTSAFLKSCFHRISKPQHARFNDVEPNQEGLACVPDL